MLLCPYLKHIMQRTIVMEKNKILIVDDQEVYFRSLEIVLQRSYEIFYHVAADQWRIRALNWLRPIPFLPGSLNQVLIKR